MRSTPPSAAESIRYAYAIGRVRALEATLLGEDVLRRIEDALTFAEAKRILSDTPYGGALDDAVSALDVESALDGIAARMFDEVVGDARVPDEVVERLRGTHDAGAPSTSVVLTRLERDAIDRANISALVRLRRRNVDRATAVEAFVPGGTLDVRAFVTLASEPSLAPALREKGVRCLEGVDLEWALDPERIDGALADSRRRIAHDALRVATGLEPLVAYVVLRRDEAVRLRTLLVARLACGWSAADEAGVPA